MRATVRGTYGRTLHVSNDHTDITLKLETGPAEKPTLVSFLMDVSTARALAALLVAAAKEAK